MVLWRISFLALFHSFMVLCQTAPTAAPSFTYSPAPDIFHISTTSTKSSVTAEVFLSQEGTVFCAVYAAGTLPLSSTAVIMQQQFATVTSVQDPAVIELSGLQASTLYDVYCAARSNYGEISLYIDTLDTKVSVITSCCRQVEVSLLGNTFQEQTDVPNMFALLTDASPSGALTVTLVINRIDAVTEETTLITDMLYPNAVTFTDKSWTSPQYVSLVGNAPGNYTVSATFSGSDELSYEAVFRGGVTTFVLQPANVEPPTPKATTGVFSADGSTITLLFDSSTDKAGMSGVFKCNLLLAFTGSSSSTCQWTSSSSVIIRLGGTSRVAVGGTISVNADTLRAQCPLSAAVCWTWATLSSTADTVTVAKPASPISPTVAVSAPALAGPCDSPVLDIASSTGSGGRDWASVTITVQSQVSVTAVQDFFDNSYVVSPPTPIPRGMLTSGNTYNFQIKMCNFLGGCSAKTHQLSVTDDSVPVVSILGQQARTVARDSTLLLQAQGHIAQCDGSKIYSGLELSWRVLVNGVADPSILSTTSDVTKFKLPPYSLISRNLYELSVTAKSVTSQLSATATVQVLVSRMDIVPVIAGGVGQTIRQADTLLLDASGSYDADRVDRSDKSGLTFVWNCHQYKPKLSSTCGLVMAVEDSRKLMLSATSDPLPSVGSVFAISVTVSDATRQSVSTVYVTVEAAGAPKITLSYMSKAVKINSADELVLQATIEQSIPGLATWSVDDASISLATKSKTPTSQTLPAGSNTIFLVLSANSLVGKAGSYLFSLSVEGVASSLSVMVNTAPTPGIFTVSPHNGTAMTTKFVFSADKWADDDWPVTYEFGYVTKQLSVNVVRGRAENTFGTSTLPGGDSSGGYVLLCQVVAFDSLNAFVAVQTDAIVTAPMLHVAELQDTIASQLSATEGDLNSRREIISVTSSVLNDQNCSSAPDCGILFRASCASTPNTCGKCLHGYIGVDGDDNSACLSEFNVPGNVENTSCSSDADCNAWHYCDATVCTQRRKECTNGCSGNGKCVAVVTDSGTAADICYLRDSTCEAVCECQDGFAGAMCHVSEDVSIVKMTMRELLLSNLLSLAEVDDPTDDSIASWQSALNAITSAYDELSLDGSEVALDIADKILVAASNLDISYENMRSLLNSIDAAIIAAAYSDRQLSVRRRLTKLATAIDLLDTYSTNTAVAMVSGQGSETSIGSSFRMTTQVLSDGGVLSVPQTKSEALLGTNTASCTIESDSSQKVSLMSIQAKLYGAVEGLTSNALRIRFIETDTDSDVPVITVVLQNTAAQTYETVAGTTYVNTTCEVGGTILHHHHCPGPLGGFTLTHECNGTNSYLMESQCPILTVAPTCEILGMANIFNCSVQSHTYTNTTCLCEVNLDSNGRRRTLRSLGALEESGALEVAAVSVLVANDFVTTISTADDFNSPADLKKTITVILMYGFLWAGGLLGVFVCSMRHTHKTFRAEDAAADLQRKKNIAASTRSKEAIRNYLTAYVNEIFPAVFRPTASSVRFWNEISKHHRYLLLFTAQGENAETTRIITCIHLLTIQSMLMFILAVCYDLQVPNDDGSCASHTTETDCLHDKSPFDTAKSVCEWMTNDGMSECLYVDVESGISIKAIVIISIVVAVFTAPINLLVDFIFIEVLSAPSTDTLKVQGTDGSVTKRAFRRLSKVTRRVSAVSVQAINQVRKSVLSTTGSRKSSARKFEVDTTRLVPDSAQEAQILATQSVVTILDEAKQTIKGREESRKSQRMQSRLSLVMAKQELRAQRKYSSFFSSLPTQVDAEVEKELDGPVDDGEAERVGSLLLTDKKLREKFAELCVDIMEQRKLLKRNQQDGFDAMWGIDPTGEFSQQRQVAFCLDRQKSAEDIILSEMKYVKEEVRAKYEKLRFASDVQTGVEILHLFVLDLLGRDTPVAKIFLTKSEEDFRHSMVVSTSVKALAWTVVVIINLFFVYFSMLRGLERGQSWQNMYLMACILQFVIEVVFYETSECAIVHYYVPSLAKREVQTVSFTLHQAVQKICAKTLTDNVAVVLDAPRYLFVSTNLARRFPDLLESVIVQSYHTYTPGEFSKKWNISHGSPYAMVINPWARSNSRVRRFTLYAAFITLMQQLGATNPILQRVLIHTVQPLIVSGFCLLLVLFGNHPWYSVITAPFVVYGTYHIYDDYRREKLEAGDVHPAIPSDDHPAIPPMQHMSSENYMDLQLPRRESSSRQVSSGDNSRKSSNDTVGDLPTVKSLSSTVNSKPMSTAAVGVSLDECKDIDADSSSDAEALVHARCVESDNSLDAHEIRVVPKETYRRDKSARIAKMGDSDSERAVEGQTKTVLGLSTTSGNGEVASNILVDFSDEGGNKVDFSSSSDAESGVEIPRSVRPLVDISESEDSDTAGAMVMQSIVETDSSLEGPVRVRSVGPLSVLSESEEDSVSDVRPVRRV